MSTYTPYLNLLKKNPLTEGSDTFNITTMLNDNWDKIDSGLATMAIRPNLLDNWYFVGGGSQQGGGQFPINQRGATSYTGAVYGVDRWKAMNNGSTVSLVSAGMRLTANSNISAGNRLLYQEVESPGVFGNKTLTLSFYVSEFSGSAVRAAIRCVVSGSATYTSVTIDGTGLYVVTAAIPSGVTSVEACFLTLTNASMSSGSYFTVRSIKLEIGPTQTLAHQENGVWILNEIPNYEHELAKCQRYFLRFDYHAGNYGTMFGKATSTSSARVTLPLPVRMRTTPTLSSKGQIRIEYNGSGAISTDYSVYSNSDEGVTFTISSLSSGSLPGDGYPVFAFFNTDTDTDLSADL